MNYVALRSYRELFLLHNVVAPTTNSIASIIVIFSLVVLSVFMWLAVNCYYVIPFVFVCISFTAFVVGIGLILNVMLLLAWFRNKSIFLIKDNLERHYSFAGGRKGYIWKMWRAMQPLPINCGHKFAFTKDAVVNYMRVLTDAVVNVSLLFKL